MLQEKENDALEVNKQDIEVLPQTSCMCKIAKWATVKVPPRPQTCTAVSSHTSVSKGNKSY